MTSIVPKPEPRKSVPRIKDEVDYFKWQAEGIRKMLRMASVLLADDMGLGKCIQALTVAACALDTQWCNRVLTIVPAGLKYNWQDEIDGYGRNYSCTVLEGTPDQRISVINTYRSDILIVNYEQVIKHVDLINKIGFDLIIYDEAHYIKNRRAARTKACMKLQSPRHFLLTGSPVLNQVDDLWTLLHRVAPAVFPDYYRFINRYAVYGGYQNKQIVGIKNEKELRERIAPYVIRREKKELGLKGKLPTIVEKIEFHPDQKKLYDKVAQELELPNPDDMANPFKIQNSLVKLLRLKEICGTPACVGWIDNSPKLDRAVEICQQFIAKGKSIVVFTQFRMVQACFVDRLAKVGINAWMLHGDVKPEDRQKIVNVWTADTRAGRPAVLCSMWQVGGIGLNFTAASTCMALDKLWVPKLNEQGYDRLDRIGQTEPVQIIELMMRGSIETRIEQVLKRKQTIFGAVMDVDSSDWKRKLIEAVKYDMEQE